jgi:type III secretion protein S
MHSGELQSLMSNTLLVVLWLSLPALGIAATVGLVVGLLQAVTQIQDQSLPQTVKLVAVLVVIAIVGPLLAPALLRHAEEVFDRFPELTR